MNKWLINDSDTIPFFLKKEVIASLDTIPENEFISYQFLPLDSTNVFYDVSAFNGSLNYESFFSGLPVMARSFMHQYGSFVFLIFTICFVLSSIVLTNSRQTLLNNFRYLFTLSNQNKNIYKDQITTSEVWGHIFFVLQTIIIYSILFFAITLNQSSLSLHSYENLLLFALINVGILLFIFTKLAVYKMMMAVFSDTKTNSLIDTYLSVIYQTGIFSFLPIFLYIYIEEVRPYALILIILIFILARLIIFTKTYSFFIKSHIGFLYFFVYLCGVEIMPYFLVYKAIILIN